VRGKMEDYANLFLDARSLKVCGGFALDEEVYPSEAFDAPAESLQIGQKT